jgi:hypothetical protein
MSGVWASEDGVSGCEPDTYVYRYIYKQHYAMGSFELKNISVLLKAVLQNYAAVVSERNEYWKMW